MKLLILLIGTLIAATGTFSPHPPISEPGTGTKQYGIDFSHSEVSFTVRHMMISRVKGTFDEYDGEIFFDPADLSSLRANATIQTLSINTRNERRDNHLRSADFFDGETHPEIRFVTTGVQDVRDDGLTLLGDLTIRGVTQTIELDVTFNGSITDQQGRERVSFSAATTIDRHDYGVSWNRTLDAGGVVVSDNVTINLEIQAIALAQES